MMKTKGKLTIIFILFCLASLNSIAIFGVKAQSAGAIVIRADGSISGTSLIQRQAKVYSLTGNIYDSPIAVLCSNIVLDGKGFTLQGAGGWGTPGVEGAEKTAAINLTCSNVTVRNFDISGWEVGVSGAYNSNIVTDNNVSQTENAVAIYADNYVVSQNILTNSIYGVDIKANNNFVCQNQIASNYCGIMMYATLNTTVTKNSFTGDNVCLTIGTYSNFSYQIYNNNFAVGANTTAVETNSDALGPANVGTLPAWDNGSVGNYWSDYTAKYPNAAQVGNSGIGNTPYTIRTSPTVVDHYPLVTPAAISNVSNPNSAASKAALPPTGSSSNPRSIAIESAIVAAIISAVTACAVLVLRNKLFWLQKSSKPA